MGLGLVNIFKRLEELFVLCLGVENYTLRAHVGMLLSFQDEFRTKKKIVKFFMGVS